MMNYRQMFTIESFSSVSFRRKFTSEDDSMMNFGQEYIGETFSPVNIRQVFISEDDSMVNMGQKLTWAPVADPQSVADSPSSASCW
jgi:hypothetical protein